VTPAWIVWVRRALVAFALVAGVVLLLTGVWLWSHYRPTPRVLWNDVVYPQQRGLERTRLVHRWASHLLMYDALALLALAIADPGARRRWWPAGAWFVLGTAALGFTGYLLPWDQLALRAVTVGTNIRGLNAAWSDRIRFVLIDGAEIGKDTVHRWAILHTIVLPIAVVAGVGALALVARRRQTVPVAEEAEV
jgi:quinol-cytochrome oxidoreductase complex cytochrome b subunit